MKNLAVSFALALGLFVGFLLAGRDGVLGVLCGYVVVRGVD